MPMGQASQATMMMGGPYMQASAASAAAADMSAVTMTLALSQGSLPAV